MKNSEQRLLGMSTTFPTEPKTFQHDGICYRVWQNDFRWWVAGVDGGGGEYHGATRNCVVRCAIDEIDAAYERTGLFRVANAKGNA